MVGNAGAGKTTFARRLAAAVGVPHLELDAEFWAEDWQLRAQEDALTLLREFLARWPGLVPDARRAGSCPPGAGLQPRHGL